MESGYPQVSVLIPVFNDERRLGQCLEALEGQTYPKDSYEVIVIDNASTVDIKSVVARFGQASYAYEEKRGSYAARNKGLTVASGKIIAFTDSDCIPAANWIESGVATLAGIPNCGLVAGVIQFFYKDADHLTAVELYERVLGFPQKKYIEEERFGATANVFTYRKILDAVGWFDAERQSGGDRDWGQRVHAAGYALYYADDVVVAHPARATYSEMYSKTIRVMSGLSNLSAGRLSRFTVLKQLVRGLLIPPFSRIRLVLEQAGKLSLWQTIKLVSVVLFGQYVWVLEKARIRQRQR